MIPAFMIVALMPATAAPTAHDRAAAYYHFSLGQQARLIGNTEEALSEYRKAQKLDPRSQEVHTEMARLLKEAGRFAEALAEAKEGVSLDPKNAEGHRVLGELLRVEDDSPIAGQGLRKAVAEFEEAARLEPGDMRTLLVLADSYSRLQQPKDAARVFEQVVEIDPGNAEAYLDLGRQYLAAGEVEQAASALKKVVELQPSALAYQNLGDIYDQAQQTDQAILNYRKALELEPRSLRLHVTLGEVLFRSRRYNEALAESDAVLKLDAKNRFGLDLKGRALREMHELDEADKVADLALGLDPRDLEAAFLKVTIAEARRDYTAVISALEAVLARDKTGEKDSGSHDRLFLVHLGVANQQLGRYGSAAEAFARARAVGGEPEASLLGYHIEALVLAHDLDRAGVEIKSARSKFPDDVELAILEATVLRERGDVAAALAAVEKLRQKSPRDVKVLLQVAEFHQRAKRYPDSEAALRLAHELEPRNLAVLFQLGAVLERQKRHDEAETAFREALTVQPDSAPVLNYLGYMNVDRGVRLQEALTLIEKAVTLDPENGAYLDSLGWALFRLNRLEQAEANLRRAVAKPGVNAVVLDHLGDVLKRRGAVQEALQYWREALKGEDEDKELDRLAVERKVREAQASLEAQKKLP